MTGAESLSAEEKLRLAVYLIEQAQLKPDRPRKKWADLCGIAPDLLDGEDAQEWVSRTRREDSEHREALLRR
jgi:hypothetical protein